MLFTPEGQNAGSMDRIMLLATWANQLKREGKEILQMGMGKPTFPLSDEIIHAEIKYWEGFRKNKQSINLLGWVDDHKIDQLVKQNAASNYGDPRGEASHRETLSQALTNWYKPENGRDFRIKPEDILFTVGGAGALAITFKALSQLKGADVGMVVTPRPYYTLYSGEPNAPNTLHCIPLSKDNNFKLTPELLDRNLNQAIQAAQVRKMPLTAFLLCDPNNPTGVTYSKEELERLGAVLRKQPYQEIFIILDEAYAEMCLESVHYSFLKANPDLYPRTIVLRSATKGFSAAGERMAITICGNPNLYQLLLSYNIHSIGHAPKSLQEGYTAALSNFNPLSTETVQKIEFYKQQVQAVYAELREKQLHVSPTCPSATFYVMADLGFMRGWQVNQEANARVFGQKKDVIENDETLIYHLLFEYGLMVAPLSYFGWNQDDFYVRITCSEGPKINQKLLGILEKIKMESGLRTPDNSRRRVRSPPPIQRNSAVEPSLDIKRFLAQTFGIQFHGNPESIHLEQIETHCLAFQKRALETLKALLKDFIESFRNSGLLSPELVAELQYVEEGKAENLDYPKIFIRLLDDYSEVKKTDYTEDKIPNCSLVVSRILFYLLGKNEIEMNIDITKLKLCLFVNLFSRTLMKAIALSTIINLKEPKKISALNPGVKNAVYDELKKENFHMNSLIAEAAEAFELNPIWLKPLFPYVDFRSQRTRAPTSKKMVDLSASLLSALDLNRESPDSKRPRPSFLIRQQPI